MVRLRHRKGTASAAFGGERPIVPEGEYDAEIIETERKAMRSGNGDALVLKWAILEGPQEGQWLWSRLNLWHDSAKVRAFAEQELDTLLDCMGLDELADTTELEGQPVRVIVKHNEWDGRNFANVEDYKPVPRAPRHPAPAPSNADTGDDLF